MKPLHVRLAAWGTVLVLAAVAFNLRTGAADEVEQGANGPQLNGRTSQGQPIWAVAEDGRVREIRMVWKVRCEDGAQVDPVGLIARRGVDGFRPRGASGFTFADSHEFDEGDGWTSTVRSRIEGTGSRGTASVEVRFRQRDVDGFTCRSGQIRWSVG
jgi:hypothetical protein